MNFLSDIVARKRDEVAGRRSAVSEAELENRLDGRRPQSLFDALSPTGGPCRVIAEVKRASPSVGTIDASVDAAQLASRYASARAAAISILTDGPGFGGSLEDLKNARAAVKVPLLRKDFLIDRYQLLEAHAWGADAILLIVAALEPHELRTLHTEASALGLSVLTEVHDEHELEVALEAGARIIGINNRNLKTFEIDPATSEKLLPKIPSGLRGVAESGIRSVEDAARLRRAGAANFLIGEALVRAASPEALLSAIGALP